MTTINDIGDLVKILQERPEWRATISNLLLGDDLLNLPRQLALFIEATNENFRQMTESIQALTDHARQTDENFRRMSESIQALTDHARQTDENFRRMSESIQALTDHARQTDENFRQVNENLQALNDHARQTDENFRQVNENLQALNDHARRTDEHARRSDGRLNRLEGRVGNLEGKGYEQSIINRVLFRAERRFSLDNPVIAMSQFLQKTPELNRLIARAIQSGTATDEELDDLHESDIIISDDQNRHIVVEVSLTVDNSDIERAARRANIMAAISGAESMPALATDNIPEPQQTLAESRGVAVFIIPNR